MIEKKILELLNRELDGPLTQEDRQTLDALVQTRDEVRKLRHDLHAMAGLCRHSLHVDPPPTILPGVRRRIEESRQPVRSTNRLMDWFIRLVTPALPLRPAYVLLTGIALGAVGLAVTLALLQDPTVRETEVVGSMVSRDIPWGGWTTHAVTAGSSHGLVATRVEGSGERVLVRIASDGSEPVDVRFELGARTVRQVIQPDSAETVVEVFPGTVRMKGREIRDVQLVLSRAVHVDDPVRISILQGGELVSRLTLSGPGAAAATE